LPIGTRRSARRKKGKRQRAKGKRENRTDRKNGTFDLQPSTFDSSKNEATDLLDNKGSVSTKIRNEATVEGSRQSATGGRQEARKANGKGQMANGKGDDRAHCEQKAVVIPEAAECADRETKPEGDPEAAERRHNLAQGESPGISGHPLPSLFPFDLQPSTFDLLKNEATDLLDNKRSASSEIRNEATVESSRR